MARRRSRQARTTRLLGARSIEVVVLDEARARAIGAVSARTTSPSGSRRRSPTALLLVVLALSGLLHRP